MMLDFLALIVCVYSFIAAALMVRLAVQKFYTGKKADIEGALSVFRNGKDSSSIEMADAASLLVSASYFTVHVHTNKGENYKDHVQQKYYKQSLTPSALAYINSIEGNYE